jgi:hypothetical protein
VGPADEPRGTPWAERVTAIAGAITAVAGFVVIPGSIAMLVRLERANLPADLGVVVSLPSQFLLAVGLGWVIGPLLLMVGLALAVTWLPGSRGSLTPALIPPPAADPGSPDRRTDVKWWHYALLIVFLVAMGVSLPFVVYGGSPPVAAFALSFGAAIVFLGAAWVIGRLEIGRGVAFGLASLVAALSFVGWAIAFAGVRADFPATTLCFKTGGSLDGVLVGRTSDHFYVGEPENEAALLGVEDPLTRANIMGGLQSANIGAKLIDEPEARTFQRANVVIADVTADVAQADVALLATPSDAGVPILGYYSEGDDVGVIQRQLDDADLDVILVREEKVRQPPLLRELVDKALASTPPDRQRVQPARRIASVPNSEVSGYRLGAAGPCPVKDQR